MIVSIAQPAYIPWLGYFDRIYNSDFHIVLDDVQIERNTKTSFTDQTDITVETQKAKGNKCSVCWKIRTDPCERHGCKLND